MTKRVRWAHRLLAVAVSVAVSGSVLGQASEAPVDPSVVQVQISTARGADRTVDYASLVQFGPWDDRNYALTARDLQLLSPNEHQAQDPIPAFYRVEMRRANPNLLRTGPGQYPRSALNGFLAKYGGYQVDGVTYTRIRAVGNNRFEILNASLEASDESGVLPNFLGGEARITTPAGAAESAISVSPVNNNLVIAGTNGPGSGQKMWRSTDGGATWSGAISLPVGTCCDPAVGWSPDGSVAYAAALSPVVGGGTNILFFRSTNSGQSWTLAKQLNNGNASDKEYFTVDNFSTSPFFGRIHMAWHDGNVQKYAFSSDGGLNWSAIQTLDSGTRGIGSDLTTDHLGNTYFFFPSISGGSNAQRIRMLKSTNGGTSFAAGLNVASTFADFDFPIPSMETRRAFVYVSADADKTGGTFHGRIYASWTDSTAATTNTAANNHARVQVAYSSNGGSTWTVTTPHPTADAGTVDRFNQWLSVDGSGRVFVMYYDTRHSTGRTGTDIYYSVSTNGAQTWSTPARLTTVTSRNITDSFEWGDYNGMDAMMQNLIAIYTDNRDESGGTAQSVDVYAVGGFGGTSNNPPVAGYSFTTSGLTANFTDSSTDSDGTIASRSWNFGDSTSSTATNPSKTYAAAGTYSVTLTVTDNGGATDTETKSVTVTSGTNAPPVANYSFTTSGLTANFTDSSTDSDGTIASRSWNFGDSTSSTATNPSKTYAAAGTYSVTLTVTDNGGATDTETKSVTVTAPPPNVLQNNVPVSGISGASGSQQFWTTATIPAGASNLVINITGGTGDADLYVRFGSAPTLTTYNCRPYLSGNVETCTFAAPSAGTYHVMLHGYTAYSGVTLKAQWTTGGQQSFFENQTDFAILDNTTIESPISVVRTGNAPSTLQCAVTIFHTYKGDLKVDLIAPDGSVYVLHNRTGGSADNIIQTFTVNASSEVAQGTWKLRVNDNANADTGTLDKWSLQF